MCAGKTVCVRCLWFAAAAAAAAVAVAVAVAVIGVIVIIVAVDDENQSPSQVIGAVVIRKEKKYYLSTQIQQFAFL